MTTMNRRAFALSPLLAGVAGVLAAAAGAAAQTDALYMSTGVYSNMLYTAQGGAITQSASRAGADEAGIAVWGDVRTVPRTSGTGGRYDLALAYQGTPYASASAGHHMDGTTDGQYNYAFAYPYNRVLRFDRDWQNPVVAVTLSEWNCNGITFDTATGRFWGYSDTGANHIFSFDLSGTIYSSFVIQGNGPFQNALAYEPSSDTLWTVSQGYNQNPYFTQYSKAGVLLQQYQVPGFTDQFVTGAEFDLSLAPAPGALGLASLASVIIARRRR